MNDRPLTRGTLNLDSCVMAYLQTSGESTDIVWVPGGDQAGGVYEEFFDAFTPDYRCTSYDPRGAGETRAKSEPPWTIQDHARDCVALIEAICKPPVFLTGLSFGALIVQEVALTRPDLLIAAIPMGTSGRKSGFLHEWETSEIDFAASGGRLPPDLAVIHYATLCYPAEVLGDDELWSKCRPFIADAYDDRDPSMLAAQWQACVEYDSLDRLPDCKVPMHVVAFSQDMQTPPSRGRAVADAAADGHFHLLDGLGHYSMFGHRPKAVTDCLRSIVDSYP